MKKRIICGFLAAILAFQPIPQGVYGMENVEISEENAVGDSDTEKILSASASDLDEMSEEENIAKTYTEVEVDVEMDEDADTETENAANEDVVTEIEDEKSDEIIAETEKEEATSGVSDSDLDTLVSEESESVSSNSVTSESAIVSETELATFSNLTVEKIGYQYARITMDVVCADGVRINAYDLWGGVECSEDSLSTKTEYTEGVQRLFRYSDENGNDIKDRFYIDVKVHGEKEYTYTPFVQVTDANGEKQIVTSGESVKIIGKRFEDLNPVLRFESGITTAILGLEAKDYNYDVDGYLNASVYYRKAGESDWTQGSSSVNSSTMKVTISGLTEKTGYEAYIEITNRIETDKKVTSEICSFTTEEDKVYTAGDFPDEVFYEYILDRCGGEQITQGELDEIESISITVDNIVNGLTVESIEGIQYLKNLDNIYISGQEITDASVISELKYVENIDMNSNELTKLPDLSGMQYLKTIDFRYNKIEEGEIVESKLPENSDILETLNWSLMNEYQIRKPIAIEVPEVCYGWGESQPIVFNVKNLKAIDYNLEIEVDGKTFNSTLKGGWYSKRYLDNVCVIPNTGLQPGVYKDVSVKISDCYGNEKVNSSIGINLIKDESIVSTDEIGIGMESFMLSGMLLGTNQQIKNIELIKESEVYGTTEVEDRYTYISTYTICGEERYNDFFYGDTGVGYIDSSLFDCEREAIEYLTSIYVIKELVNGDYDLKFTFNDGSTVIQPKVISIDDASRVYSLDNADALSEYKSIYNNSGDYIYVTLRGFGLDTEKVWPEIYLGDTVLTQNDGIEVIEETGTAEMKYYVYRLKKIDIDTYWKKSQNFRWRLCTEEGYVCQDLATEHGYEYIYDYGIEIDLFWVDEHLTKDTCKIYIKSSLPNNTSVKVTAWDRYDYYYQAEGEGTLNNGILTLDLYDENGELFYPAFNASEFIFEFATEEDIIKVESYLSVYNRTGSFMTGTNPAFEKEGISTVVYVDEITETTIHGIQWGTDTVEKYEVNFYLPNTNEKQLSLNLSESSLCKYKSYFFTKEDIKNLNPTAIYRIDVKDKNGVRLLNRFYARVTSEVEDAEVILPTKVTLNASNINLDLNQTYQLRATVSPSNATDKSVTWSSTNTNVATVDSTGLIKVVGYGKSYITAITVNGKFATCTVNVASIEPKGIKLSQTTANLQLGNSLQLTATINPDNATDRTITWTSDNPECVAVSQEGLVTAVNPGKAVITAGTVNGKQASCTVISYNPDGGEVTLKPEETFQLPVPAGISSGGLKYSSDNTSAVTVSSKGLLSAVGIGAAKITQQSGDILITYAVTVTNPLQKISFEEEDIVIELRESATNRIIFEPVYTDSDKTLNVTVENNTIAEAVIVDEKIIKITGLSEGTTTVRVTCGELQTECNVTVQNTVAVPDTSQHMIYALTNRHKTLADISDQLMPGFVFEDAGILLSKFAGESEKEFAVIYTDENGRTKQSVQNIKLLTITGISTTLDKTGIEVESEEKAILTADCLWSGYPAEESVKKEFLQNYEFEVTSDKAGIVKIENAGSYFSILGIKEGKVKLTITLREKDTEGKEGILYKETLEFIVSEKIADIRIEVMGASYNEEEDYYYINDIQTAEVSIKAVAEDYKLTWSSSDTGIAKVEKAVDGISKVTLKNNGKVRLTVTANDTGKTSKSILLYVIDTKPSIDSAVTINKAHENGATIGIYASYGYDIRQYDVQLMQKDNIEQSDDRFAIDYNSQKDTYEIVILDQDAVSQGKYSVVVKVTAATDAGEQEYYSDLLITVTNKPVTYTVKQNTKVNLFYSDEEGDGVLTISCKNAEIEGAELSDCDFSYDYATGNISFDGGDYENADKTGILNIKFKEYAPVSKAITVSTENKKPSVIMSATSSVLYPNVGIKKAQLQILDKTTKDALWIENRNINQDNLEEDAYYAYASDGNVYLQLKEGVEEYPKTAKIKFAIQLDNWNEEITFTHTVKSQMLNNPTLALSSSTLTLNKNANVARYQEADVNVKIKDATENTIIEDVVISGADKKALGAMNRGVDFDFEAETGTLTASFNNSNAINKGTYNYNVRTQIAEDKSITTKMKVSIIDKDTIVSISTKGTIDILDRENTSVVCTPKLKNISGEIMDVVLAGTDAHLFTAELDNMGKTILTAKDDTAYITNYPYKIYLIYTLQSGGREYKVNSNAVTVKVKQGTVNLVSSLSSSHLYQAANNSLNLNVTAINASGESVAIKDISIVETKAMKDVFAIDYNESAESYQLSLKDATKVKKGKTYSIKMNIRFVDQADNEKAKTVTVKVTIK